MIAKINPILRRWVSYFRVRDSHRCFSYRYIRNSLQKKTRRHVMRNQNGAGYRWKKCSGQWLYKKPGVWSDCRVIRYEKLRKVTSASAVTQSFGKKQPGRNRTPPIERQRAVDIAFLQLLSLELVNCVAGKSFRNASRIRIDVD